MKLELIEAFRQGDYIDEEMIAEILGYRKHRNPEQYQWDVLNLIRQIELHLTQKWGNRTCQCCQQENGIKIMTESEIVEYNARRIKAQERQVRKQLYHLSRRDSSQLSDQERFKLMSTQRLHAYMVDKFKKGQAKYPVASLGEVLPTRQAESFKQRKRFG